MKRLFLVFLLAAGVAGLGFSFQAGGGYSIYVPESLYLHGQGSISFETNFEYAISLSKHLSFPIGISYTKIYGYTPGGTASLDTVTSPWFFGDSVMGYLMAKLHLPVSIFYFNLFGGGAVNWNATVVPIDGAVESYLAPAGGSAAMTSLTAKAPWGVGWLAGAGFGVSIKKLSIGLSATYRDVRSPLTLTGSYYAVSSTGSISAPASSISLPGAELIMRGISVGLNGQFSF